MWCTECKQDVPAIASQGKTRQVVCARCGFELATAAVTPESNGVRLEEAHPHAASRRTAELSAPAAEREAPIAPSEWDSDWIDDDWTCFEDIMRANVAVNMYRTTAENGLKRTERRLRTQETPIARYPTNVVSGPTPGFQIQIAWIVVCLGMTILAFGGVLTGWSMAAERPDLWRIGLPTFFVGQGILVVGLLFQLERLLQSHRNTETTLGQLHETTGRLARESSIREQMELVQ